MLAALVMLVVFRRDIGWPEVKALFGRGTKVERCREVAIGWAAALLTISVGIAWALASDRLGPTLNEYSFISVGTLTAFTGGLAAAAIEEMFFRGMMLHSLTATLGRSMAVDRPRVAVKIGRAHV